MSLNNRQRYLCYYYWKTDPTPLRRSVILDTYIHVASCLVGGKKTSLRRAVFSFITTSFPESVKTVAEWMESCGRHLIVHSSTLYCYRKRFSIPYSVKRARAQRVLVGRNPRISCRCTTQAFDSRIFRWKRQCHLVTFNTYNTQYYRSASINYIWRNARTFVLGQKGAGGRHWILNEGWCVPLVAKWMHACLQIVWINWNFSLECEK